MLDPQKNRGQLETAIRNTIQQVFGSDEYVDLIFGVTGVDDSDNLKITLLGLTLDDDGEIVPKSTTYRFDANIVTGFSGTIQAQNRDQAEAKFADWVEDLELRDASYSDDADIEVQYLARHELYNLED